MKERDSAKGCTIKQLEYMAPMMGEIGKRARSELQRRKEARENCGPIIIKSLVTGKVTRLEGV